MANFAIVPVAADGTVSFTNNSSGTVQLIADTSGYYLGGTPTAPGAFSAQTPTRQLDTRNGTGGTNGPVGAGQTVNLKVTGHGGIPASGVSAVALNITVTSTTAVGNITAYAGGTPEPGTSNVNYVANQTVPNFAIVPVGADGTVSFTNNSSGTVQLIADTSGYYLAGTPTATGAFSAQTPTRQLDTRNGTGGTTGPVGAGQTVNLKVTGRGGIPASGVSAVALNLTVTSPTSFGNITAYAGRTPEPGTSNVNFDVGQTVPNLVIVPVGADGTVSFKNNSSGTVQLIADTSGYSTAPATGQPGPHRLQSMTSTPATGTATTNTFTWDAAGRMTGRAGETLSYTTDGKLSATTGTSTLPVNPNPSATAGTPPGPVTGTAGSTGTRYYDAAGNLVGLIDGTGTTVTLGSVTAHSTPGGVQTATKSYTFAGKTLAQRAAAGGIVKLAFIISDGVDTAQTIVQASAGATPATAQTRYTDPMGLARGPTQAAGGSGAYATAPAGTTGVGSNDANPTGYGAVNGYIGGLADTISTLTHLGARDLDPVLGAFTSPDPVLKPDVAKNFSPYVYGEADAINNTDPSGLMILGPKLTDGDGGWYGYGAVDSRWEDAHPFNDYFLPWKPIAYQRFYASVVPVYHPVVTAAPEPEVIDADETMAYIRKNGNKAASATALRYLSFDASFVPGLGGLSAVGLDMWANSLEGKPAIDEGDGLYMAMTVGAGPLGKLAKIGKLGAEAAKAADDGVDLYRHVSPGELADIEKSGFQPGKNSLGGKWFAESGEHAAQWGSLLNYGEGSVVKVRVSGSFADQLMRLAKLDGIGPARYVGEHQLDQLNRFGWKLQ